jgi:hypothetical protein
MSKIYKIPGEIYQKYETGELKGFKRFLVTISIPLLVVAGFWICFGVFVCDYIKGNKNMKNCEKFTCGSCTGCNGSGINQHTKTPCRCEYGIGND